MVEKIIETEVKAVMKKIRKKKKYVIVDAKTGELLDDCNGYGYNTGPAAHRGYSYKVKRKFHPEKMKNKQVKLTPEESKIREIQEWLLEHKTVLRTMRLIEADNWIHATPIDIDDYEIEGILEEKSVVAPYTVSEINKAFHANGFNIE